MRLWRNTDIASLAPGGVATLAVETLGYEWDEDLDNGARPAGLIRLSSTTRNVGQKLQDNGSSYAPGIATHSLTMYRSDNGDGPATTRSSSARARSNGPGASTATTTVETPAADSRMQQATVNLFADMGVQPATLRRGACRRDGVHGHGGPLGDDHVTGRWRKRSGGNAHVIMGTATDAGGASSAASRFRPMTARPGIRADGRGQLDLRVDASRAGPATIHARASTTARNLGVAEQARRSRQRAQACPCSIFAPSVTADRANRPERQSNWASSSGPTSHGFITGIRFYKTSQNTGTHTGTPLVHSGTNLGDGDLLWRNSARDGRRPRSPRPSPLTAGTTYVASYHTTIGLLCRRRAFATAASTARRCTPSQDGADGPNGVYVYGAGGTFPTNTFDSSQLPRRRRLRRRRWSGYDRAHDHSAYRRLRTRPVSP